MQVISIDNNLFDVTSERDPERSYVVEAGKSCTCPHWKSRLVGTGKLCKHLNQVAEYLGSQRDSSDFQRALRKAEGLSDAELMQWAKTYEAGPVAGACRLTLAQRKLQEKPRAIPEGVLVLLQGCTPEERERALAVYE